jgi:hypothetical protein
MPGAFEYLSDAAMGIAICWNHLMSKWNQVTPAAQGRANRKPAAVVAGLSSCSEENFFHPSAS